MVRQKGVNTLAATVRMKDSAENGNMYSVTIISSTVGKWYEKEGKWSTSENGVGQ